MIGLVGGLAIGSLFFAHLRYSVKSLRSVRQPLLFMIRGYLFRLILLTVGMVALARFGPFHLMSAALGMALVRCQMVRSARWS